MGVNMEEIFFQQSRARPRTTNVFLHFLNRYFLDSAECFQNRLILAIELAKSESLIISYGAYRRITSARIIHIRSKN
jgi:hypothetical protein